MLALRFRAFCNATSWPACLLCSSVWASSKACCETSSRLEELFGAVERAARLRELGGRSPHVGRIVRFREMLLDRSRRTARACAQAPPAAAETRIAASRCRAGRAPDPACTRSPRSARIARTVPSASDDTVTWSTAVRVPTTSTDLRTEFRFTGTTVTCLAWPSELPAWAVSDFVQPAAVADR